MIDVMKCIDAVFCHVFIKVLAIRHTYIPYFSERVSDFAEITAQKI